MQMIEDISDRDCNNMNQKLIQQEKAERLSNNKLKCLEICIRIVS